MVNPKDQRIQPPEKNDIISLGDGDGAIFQSPSRMRRLKEHKKEWRLWLFTLGLTFFMMLYYLGNFQEKGGISLLTGYFTSDDPSLFGRVAFKLGTISAWGFLTAVTTLFCYIAVLPRKHIIMLIRILTLFFFFTLNVMGFLFGIYLLWVYPKFLAVVDPKDPARSSSH